MRRMWHASPELTAIAVLMIVIAVPASVAALAFDHRVIVGAAAWIKPLKFSPTRTVRPA